MPYLIPRDLIEDDDCDLLGTDCRSRPSSIQYIVASIFIFLLFVAILILLLLSRRRRNRGQPAYYGTRWIFRSPPAVPPRPGFAMNNYSAGGHYSQQTQGGSYYPPPAQSPYYPPPQNGGIPPAPMQTPYTTGSTYTTMPTSPGQAHVQPHYGQGGLRGGDEEELPPPPKYTPGPYGAQIGTNSTGGTREDDGVRGGRFGK